MCRRLIGRRFDDPSVKTDVKSWPFTVIDRDGNPYIQVEYLGETKQFSPQEISSMVLTKVYTYLFPIQGQCRNILCVFVGHADEGNCRGQAWPICRKSRYYCPGLFQRQPATGYQGCWCHLWHERPPYN